MGTRSYRLWGVMLLIGLLVLWQVSARYWVSSTSWPPVTDVLRAVAAGLANGELLQVFGSTLWRMAAGFAIGSAAGVLIGLLMATFPLANAALRSLFELKATRGGVGTRAEWQLDGAPVQAGRLRGIFPRPGRHRVEASTADGHRAALEIEVVAERRDAASALDLPD